MSNRLSWQLPIGILVVLAVLFGFVQPRPVQAATGQLPTELQISVSMNNLTALTGDSLSFTSTISNDGSTTTPPLIAILNFVSIDHSTYVDPEDWSPRRTISLDPIDPGQSVTHTWQVEAVLKGDVGAFVVVLPDDPSLTTSGPLVSSPAVHVHVDQKRTLNPGGVLPVALVVPSVLAVIFGGLQLSRRVH